MQLLNGLWEVHASQPGFPAGPGQTPAEVIGQLQINLSMPDPQPVCIPTSVDWNGFLAMGPNGFTAPVSGFWDDIAQKITFTGVDQTGVLHIYTGFMFQPGIYEGLPPLAQPPSLAGHFEAFSIPIGSAIGGYAERVIYGWYAFFRP